jgi:ribosomal protein S18 acetylase RimI-like enzyme
VSSGAPDFPHPGQVLPPLSDSLRRMGVALRRATAADLPFLRTLYGGFRAEELAPAPWTPEQKARFLDDQFRLQHADWVHRYAEADFLIVEQAKPPGAGVAIGRLYLSRGLPLWRIVDIGILPEKRGAGLGRMLITWVCACAAEAGAGVGLAVLVTNPRAEALYRRLGFRETGEADAMRRDMIWTPRG